MCSDAPDLSGVNAAAAANADIAKEALAFYKEEYGRTQGQRDASVATANAVSRAQLQAQQQNSDLSADYAQYQKETFRPLEEGIVGDSQTFDTAARRDAEAAAAVADVQTATAAQGQARQRVQASMGVRPDAGRAEAFDRQDAIRTAASSAGAAYQARKGVELQGYARKMDAANLGRNLASNQATSAGVALNAGNSAVGNSNSAVATQQSGAALMGQGFNTAIQGNQSAGQLYGQAAQMQSQASQSDAAGIGQIAGMAAMFMSDEDTKTDVKPVGDEEALAAVAATPVKRWRYDPAKGGIPDGGQPHVGPMAQDVHETMGERVAPGGKKVDLISMNGITMKGLQAVNKKVNKLAATVAKMASQQGVMGVAA